MRLSQWGWGACGQSINEEVELWIKEGCIRRKSRWLCRWQGLRQREGGIAPMIPVKSSNYALLRFFLSPSPDHRTNQSTLTYTSHLPHLIQLESGKEATWTHPSAGSPMECFHALRRSHSRKEKRLLRFLRIIPKPKLAHYPYWDG